MRLGELIPAPYRLLAKGVVLAVLAGGSAAITWQVQNWRYGGQLAEQDRLHTDTLNQITSLRPRSSVPNRTDASRSSSAWLSAKKPLPSLERCTT